MREPSRAVTVEDYVALPWWRKMLASNMAPAHDYLALQWAALGEPVMSSINEELAAYWRQPLWRRVLSVARLAEIDERREREQARIEFSPNWRERSRSR